MGVSDEGRSVPSTGFPVSSEIGTMSSGDNAPYGKALFALYAAMYPEGHPYRYLTIGKHEDLANASLDDVKNFF